MDAPTKGEFDAMLATAKGEATATVRPTAAGVWPAVQMWARNWYGQVALGNGTMWQVGVTIVFRYTDGWALLISVEGHGAYTFAEFVAPRYASEKLGVGMNDAANLADFINRQIIEYLGERFYDTEPMGRYDPEFCAR